MQKQNIRIRLEAFDHRVLDGSAREIVNTAKRTGAQVAGNLLWQASHTLLLLMCAVLLPLAVLGSTAIALGYLFWLVFVLAISGGIAAGAVMARTVLPDPWVVGGGIAVAGVIGLWAALVMMSVPASHYRFFCTSDEDLEEAL